MKYPPNALARTLCPARAIACLTAGLSLYAAPHAGAIVLYGGFTTDAPANTSAPAGYEDAWARVGQGPGTGVYLGNGYVLSARHVSTGTSYSFDGTSYDVIPNTTVTLLNSDNSEADLRLFRIAVPQGTGLFGLDVLPVLQNSVATNSNNTQQGILIGTGVGQTNLQPEQLPLGDFDDTDRVGPGGYGYEWDGLESREKRWAPAEIGAPTTVTVLGRESVAFESTFKFNGNTVDGIAADRDSGAPLFYNDNGTVVLAGIVNSVTLLDFSKANNTTYLSDLAEYKDQLQFTIGDLDGDGGVGETDFQLVLSHYGTAVQAGNFLLGDADGDGYVGVNDIDYILSRWGDGPTGSITAAPAITDVTPAVPEPTSLVLIGGGLVALTLRRRRP